MSDEIKQKVSAFLDGELDTKQLAALSDEVESSPQLRSRLHRYVLISESIKGNAVSSNAESIADSVSKAIEDEPAIIAPVTRPPAARPATSEAGWKTWFAGGAIAATVATLALINFDILEMQQGPKDSFPVTVQLQPQSQPFNQPMMNSFAQPASTQWSISRQHTAEPEVEQELNQFLIEHSEYTHQSGMPGLVPYATFVVYDKK
jgi:sigma-E factor negative regulatory protein RseA